MKNALLLLFVASSICSCATKHHGVFKDEMATKLAFGVSNAKIEALENSDLKAVATALKEKNYSTDYRVATYRAYLSTEELGRQLHIGSGYSNYEGITGIYLEEGTQSIIVSGLAEDGAPASLIVPDWDRRAPEGMDPTKDPKGWGIIKEQFKLENGLNTVEIGKAGLAYISYYSNTPESENDLTVHFLNDKVNGYFDVAVNTNEEWDAMLENAVYPIIDAKGRHAQIVYPVEACQKYAAGRGVELLSNYDSLVRRQHRLIGLEKYNKIPDNHILARVNFNYYMFRDGDGVAYMGAKQGYAMGMVADPDVVISGDPCWGFSHEVGHVHQLRPFFNWGGLGEVSNNIASLYVCRSFGVESRLAQQDNYNKARKSIIESKSKKSYLQDNDVFNRLVPLWQLELYFSQNGYPDFYPDLFEELRSNEFAQDADNSRGRDKAALHQLNFVKTVCKVGKLDLTEFFDKWGFFYVGEFSINDYGKYEYVMTQEMADQAKKEIAAMNLPKPTEDLTTYHD